MKRSVSSCFGEQAEVLVTSLGDSKRKKLNDQKYCTKKRVRFQIEPNQTIESPLQVVGEDKIVTWYTRKELAFSRLYSKRLSRAIDADDLLVETYDRACRLSFDDDKKLSQPAAPNMDSTLMMLLCSGDFNVQRGLERLSVKHANARNMQICAVKSAVLLEQANQCLNGETDPMRIAQVCEEFSKASSQFALVLGLADAVTAHRIYTKNQQHQQLKQRQQQQPQQEQQQQQQCGLEVPPTA